MRYPPSRLSRFHRPVAHARMLCLFVLSAGALVSCVQSNFYGEQHAPTERATLEESFEALDRPYQIIGRLVTIERLASRQALVDAMLREAARRGADAMVLLSVEPFAWSDQPGGMDGLDPERDPIGTAIDSKQRWRGEATLIRWALPPSPESEPPAER